MEKSNVLIDYSVSLGAYKASVVDVSKITTDIAFRDMCKANMCGKYGRCYTCPPDVGEIQDLINKLKSFSYALVYQTVSALEDSFDVEGMQDAAEKHAELVRAMREKYALGTLHLGAGGCPLCQRCAKITNEPCRYPDQALASLEAYGVNVSKLAELGGMKYINGQNTVTYFGAMFFNSEDIVEV